MLTGLTQLWMGSWCWKGLGSNLATLGHSPQTGSCFFPVAPRKTPIGTRKESQPSRTGRGFAYFRSHTLSSNKGWWSVGRWDYISCEQYFRAGRISQIWVRKLVISTWWRESLHGVSRERLIAFSSIFEFNVEIQGASMRQVRSNRAHSISGQTQNSLRTGSFSLYSDWSGRYCYSRRRECRERLLCIGSTGLGTI